MEVVAINHYPAVYWSCSDEIIMLFAKLCVWGVVTRRKGNQFAVTAATPIDDACVFPYCVVPAPTGQVARPDQLSETPLANGIVATSLGSTDLKKKKKRAIKKSISGIETRQTGRHHR